VAGIVLAILVAGGVAGAGAGVALDQAGVLGSTSGDTSVAAPGPVAYARCPSGVAIGSFHQDDRVFLTGRAKNSQWVEVRDPANLDARVWVVADVVVPDNEVAQLPVHACTPEAAASASSTTTTTTTVAPDAAPTDETTTTTTAPGASPVAPPAAGGGPSGGGSPPPPGDTTPPAINQAGLGPNPIWEQAGANPNGCFLKSTYKVVANVSAVVTDPSGVASVTVSWDGAQAGSRAMSANGDSWSGSVGPFASQLPYGGQAQLTVTITARDNAGNTSTTQLALTVYACVLG